LQHQLEKRIAELKLGDIVTMHGFQPQIHDYMREMDCLVMPSLNEGLPYTLLEAMHLRVPVIASNVGGMKEILTPYETALLFDPGDVSMLVDFLSRMRKDQELRERLAENAYKRACELFEIGHMAEKYIRIYRRMVES
jgi:glycosyltransferase involved in cell wall biosynthesis